MDNLATAGAMGRSVVRKRASGDNMAEDEEANSSRSELLGTMEVDQAETSAAADDDGELPKENIFDFPETDWDAFRRDLDEEEDWEALQASLAQQRERREREREKETRGLERKETLKERWLRLAAEKPGRSRRMAVEEPEAQEKADQAVETAGQDILVSLWGDGKYREDWNAIWSRSDGSFEDTTRIPAMRFTHKPEPEVGVNAHNTLQVFSVKVASTSGGLQWPLDVFGFIAIRDIVDHNRNIIFNRTRESCQTLNEEDHNLVLVGPSRAIFVSGPHPLFIEVELKVKGTTESEDKDLSVLAVPLLCTLFYSRLIHHSYTSKLSTLQFTLGHIFSSVEATTFLRVIRGSWPDGFRCEFCAFVTCKYIGRDKNDEAADIDHEKIVLFDSRGGKEIVDNDGNIKLSTRVVSVETAGELKVSLKAWKVDNDVVEKEEAFTPSRAGISYREIDMGFCAMEVSVAWSLISGRPVTARTVL